MHNTEYSNTEILSEKEKLYLSHDESIISVTSIIFRTIAGILLLILSAFAAPSAEGRMPFSNFFSTTKKRIKFTRYRKAVIKKLDGDKSEKNARVLLKLNREDFALDEKNEALVQEEEIAKIYEKHLRENNNDQSI